VPIGPSIILLQKLNMGIKKQEFNADFCKSWKNHAKKIISKKGMGNWSFRLL
jgi:hypothetical protein